MKHNKIWGFEKKNRERERERIRFEMTEVCEEKQREKKRERKKKRMKMIWFKIVVVVGLRVACNGNEKYLWTGMYAGEEEGGGVRRQI